MKVGTVYTDNCQFVFIIMSINKNYNDYIIYNCYNHRGVPFINYVDLSYIDNCEIL